MLIKTTYDPVHYKVYAAATNNKYSKLVHFVEILVGHFGTVRLDRSGT